MNTISLLGQVVREPAYHCTTKGQDLTRFDLVAGEATDSNTTPPVHECEAWGPAALDLHEHLLAGSRLLVRGTLDYRSSGRAYVRVRGYTYLGVATCRKLPRRPGTPG